MKPQAFFISILGGLLLSVVPARSQTGELEEILTNNIKERIQMPLLFSTRDTAFALSLPDDEPAEVYLHVTVDRKGRVKEKLTRVNANHLGAYVAPEPMWPRHLPKLRKSCVFPAKQCRHLRIKTLLCYLSFRSNTNACWTQSA